jgi:hypothetical protein
MADYREIAGAPPAERFLQSTTHPPAPIFISCLKNSCFYAVLVQIKMYLYF